jgi:hypothetical protein
MANVLQATVGGTVHDLSNGDICYYVGQDGLGLPGLRRLQEQGPQQHGTTDVGFLLGPRAFQLFFAVPGESAGDVYDRRTDLLEIFRPSATPIVLTFRLPNGDVRCIDAHATGGLTFSTAQRQGYMEKVSISLSAPEPSFYDPAAEALVATLGTELGGFEVDMPIPFFVGASVINAIETIAYAGNWREYPYEIKIEGPITNARISNDTTGEVLDFAGSSLAAAQAWYIDLRYGYKTITREDTSNAIAALTEDSDLATWHLEPGNNEIHITGTGATVDTEITIAYYNRYIGI